MTPDSFHSHSHSHDHHDESEEGQGHGHTHGIINPSLTSSAQGMQAVKWSTIILLITAGLQFAVVLISGSISLLADTIHNFADAGTAIPLGIAFFLCRLPATKKFSYGYGRAEDLAGVAIVLIILFSAVVAGLETLNRFFHPHVVTHLWAVAAASIIGFAGNEIVAVFRIRTGKKMKSAALIADGYHARTDGLTSLAVLAGAIGVWLGYPLADPVVSLIITILIFVIVWDSLKAVFFRALDGVEPDVLGEINHAVEHVDGVQVISDVRARWIGHKLHVEVSIGVDPSITVAAGHDIAKEVQHELHHHMDYLSRVMVHVDPLDQPGERHHPHG